MEVAIGLGLLAITLFSSTISYALRSYSRARLSELLPDESHRRWTDRLDRYESELQVVASCLRLASILGVMIWVYEEYLVAPAGEAETASFVIATTVILGLLLLFALGVPNALAVHAGEAILARSLWLVWLLRFALYPLLKALMFVDFIVRRLVGKPETGEQEETERVEQEILEAVDEGEIHGAVDEGQKQMIRSVFELHETPVSAIMTPRTDITAIPVDATLDQVREMVVRHGHSRLPVYEKTVDHIVGVLYAKDLLRVKQGEAFDPRKLMRTAPYVPESKPVDELLDEFRHSRIQIAIILDEYGGTAGLATLEDILEELVGEIDDEYDQRAPPAKTQIDDDTLEVDARVTVYEVNEALDVKLPEEGDYETIGGFVFSTLGRIPVRGEEFPYENLQFVVIDAEPRKINRLRIRVQREAPTT